MDAVAAAFAWVVRLCPDANPSDLWQHVIYRHALMLGWSDQRWKRVSGFALERALVDLYDSRLLPHGVRLRRVKEAEANRLLDQLGVPEADRGLASLDAPMAASVRLPPPQGVFPRYVEPASEPSDAG